MCILFPFFWDLLACYLYVVHFGVHVHLTFHRLTLWILKNVLFLYYRIETEDSGDKYVSPVHEFRIPHRALMGLHTYCPVHFDAFHPVLVDLTIHIVYLKAGVTKSSLKVHRFVMRLA